MTVPKEPVASHKLGTIVGMVAALIMVLGIVAPVTAQQSTPVASPVADAESISIDGAVIAPATLTVADLQAFPAETLDVTYEAGGTPEDHTFTGTPLIGVIEDIGLDVADDARNPLLMTYLVITAKDGY